MRGDESWNLKSFLKALGLLPTPEKESSDWEIPALQQLSVAIEVLSGELGEPSKRAVARSALDSYSRLTDSEKVKFFAQLVKDYEVDETGVETAFEEWKHSRKSAELVKLIQEVEPKRQHLLRNLNHADGATLELVGMRADLLRLIQGGHDHLKPLDHDFKHLLSSWFNPGFLELHEITWEKAKSINEHLLKYESVHPMQNVAELKKRVHPRDRKIYGFTHPATGDLPLIFVEVAFTNGIPTDLDEILEQRQPKNPSKADTAVFYSINSAFYGLAGISFGDLLIKRVTELIQTTMPNIDVFTTFSPLPRFREWLKTSHQAVHRQLAEELELSGDAPGDSEKSDQEGRVVSAVAEYITQVKNKKGLPSDPVARFHLGNGATAWEVIWPASKRDYVLENSFGAMIMYRYEPEKIESQHEDFVRNQKISVGPYFLSPDTIRGLPRQQQSEVHVE